VTTAAPSAHPTATPTASPSPSATGASAQPTPTATSTAAPASPAPGASTSTSGDVVSGLLSGVVLAAIVAAVVNVWLARRRTQEEERSRVRTTLAEAYRAYADYREFPYAIRRRNRDQAAAERVRLSEALREVQGRLSYYEAWTRAESPATGNAYARLVAELRRVAGGEMRAAWQEPAVADDPGMNIGPDVVDLSSLKPAEDEFIAAAAAYVAAYTQDPWSSWRRAWPALALLAAFTAIGIVGVVDAVRHHHLASGVLSMITCIVSATAAGGLIAAVVRNGWRRPSSDS
jgi:hypothetical protein